MYFRILSKYYVQYANPAISKYSYTPLFPLEMSSEYRLLLAMPRTGFSADPHSPCPTMQAPERMRLLRCGHRAGWDAGVWDKKEKYRLVRQIPANRGKCAHHPVLKKKRLSALSSFHKVPQAQTCTGTRNDCQYRQERISQVETIRVSLATNTVLVALQIQKPLAIPIGS